MSNRTCLVCGEEVNAAAVKCRFCNALLCDETWLRVVREWRALPPEECQRRYDRLEPGQQRTFLAIDTARSSVPIGRFDIRETKEGELIRLDRETGQVVSVSTLLASAPPSTAADATEPLVIPSDEAEKVIGVQLLGKRYSVEEDMIILDLHFWGAALDRPARAIKGLLLLKDLFGETKMSIGWTLEKPPLPGASTRDNASGFSYNQFMEAHKWVANTSLGDIKAHFRVNSILLADGSKVDY